MELDIEQVCFIIAKARAFDVKEDVVQVDPASNPTDDAEQAVLADYPDDPVYEELKSLIDALNVDQQAELVALAWIGREDYVADEWDEAVGMARDRHTGSTARYLLGMPLLGDYLETGLAQLGHSCEDFDLAHL